MELAARLRQRRTAVLVTEERGQGALQRGDASQADGFEPATMRQAIGALLAGEPPPPEPATGAADAAAILAEASRGRAWVSSPRRSSPA